MRESALRPPSPLFALVCCLLDGTCDHRTRSCPLTPPLFCPALRSGVSALLFAAALPGAPALAATNTAATSTFLPVKGYSVTLTLIAGCNNNVSGCNFDGDGHGKVVVSVAVGYRRRREAGRLCGDMRCTRPRRDRSAGTFAVTRSDLRWHALDHVVVSTAASSIVIPRLA